MAEKSCNTHSRQFLFMFVLLSLLLFCPKPAGAVSFETVQDLWVNGNAGIGTTSPLASLDVAGTGIRLGGVTRTSWPTNSQWTTSGNDIYYTTGNVGIGTTGPTAKLYVNGLAYAVGATLGGNLNLNWAASRDFYIDEAQNGNYGGDLRIQAGNGEDASTESTGGGNLYIDGGNSYNTGVAAVGNIYIGSRYASPVVIGSTATTGAMVTITEPTTSLLTLYNTSTAANNNKADINFWDKRTTSGATNVATVSGVITDITQSAYKGALTFSTADNAAPAERMRIDYQGYVGIGTSFPNSKLEVNGTGYNTTLKISGTIAPGVGVFTPALVMSDNRGSGYSGIRIQAIRDTSTGGQAIKFSNTQDNNDELTGTWRDRMIIDKSGNVGIGTAGPAYKVDIRGGSISVDGILNADSGIWDANFMRSGSIGPYTSGQPVYLNNYNGTNLMTLLNGGNVGIGTTGPLASLDVAGTGIRLGGVTRTSWPTNSQWTTSGNDIYYTTGLVGIGMTNPGAKLQVNKGGGGRGVTYRISYDAENSTALNRGAVIRFTPSEAGGTGSLIDTDYSWIDSESRLVLQSYTNSNQLVLHEYGSVGIGTSIPTDLLHVAGYILATSGVHIGVDAANNLIDDASGGTGSTTLYIGNASINVTASDRRMKENIEPSAVDALGLVSKMKIMDFDWKEGNAWRDRGRATGLIAQDVYEYLPQVVSKPPEPENMWAVEYQNIVPYLIKAVQEQQRQIEELRREVEELKQRR